MPYKHAYKSHILFCGIPILCRLPSLWCPLTHLSKTNITVSYQTCSEWFHLSLWKLSMGTVAGWSHPDPKSREVSWPTGRHYSEFYAAYRHPKYSNKIATSLRYSAKCSSNNMYIIYIMQYCLVITWWSGHEAMVCAECFALFYGNCLQNANNNRTPTPRWAIDSL